MAVGTVDPATDVDNATELWRQVGDLIFGGQHRIESRLDRLEADVSVIKGDVAVLKGDVAVLKGDVGELKTGLAETNQRLDRMELANEKRFNRMDAQFEVLIALIKKDETKGP